MNLVLFSSDIILILNYACLHFQYHIIIIFQAILTLKAEFKVMHNGLTRAEKKKDQQTPDDRSFHA